MNLKETSSSRSFVAKILTLLMAIILGTSTVGLAGQKDTTASSKREYVKMRVTGKYIIFENEYIKWQHDRASGELTGAFVKNGTGKNLLTTPLTTKIIFYDYEKCAPVALKTLKTLSVEYTEDSITSRSLLGGEWLDRQGIKDAVEVTHSITYKPFGLADHCVTISSKQRLPQLFSMQVISVGLSPHFDIMTWRPTLEAGIAVWAQNNTPKWLPLYGGKRQSDMFALLQKRLPLSLLMFKRGEDGIEFTLGDNLDEWNAYRPEKTASSQEFQLLFDLKQQHYSLFYAPFNFRDDGVLEGTRSFHFQMALPFVKKYMAPLRMGAQIPYGRGGNRKFADRWPTAKDLKRMADSGYELLRLHNDGDSFRNGIFWRDAAYPPYPEDEMKKMEECLANVHKYGMKVTPYFSLKEIHPDVAEFKTYGQTWGRQDEPDGALRYTRYPGGFWGVVMCLKSEWYKKRLDTIIQVLDNHPFDGVYFDWCMALECFNDKHCKYWHWDNSEFVKLVTAVRQHCGDNSEFYLHTSNVPSLITENIATQLLTDEVLFPAVGPQMFTPHVHFLNTAPRQICNMLPAGHTQQDVVRLAMCALLHHATVATTSTAAQKLYADNRSWIKEVTKYKKHYAPGEGWGGIDSETAGMAYYENDDEVLMVFANLTKEEQTVDWKITSKGWKETITLPPMQIITQKRPNVKK